ncbi:MAG: beta-lactamase family protein [Saprospiraceae bacterium]|nr:beta-lactamase family protein [Saprospiraceae bacterium]
MGFSIAVLSEGDTLYAKGFGYADPAKSIPVDDKTIFNIASVTKPHTAAIALKLEEEGKLNLESYLLDYFPDFPSIPGAHKIKLKHLLSHTSGLPDYIEFMDSVFLVTRVDPVIDDYFSFLTGKSLLFEPGTNFSYSNTGFVLITHIIERVSGEDYSELIQRVIAHATGSGSLNLQKFNQNKSSYSPLFTRTDSGFVTSLMNELTYIQGDGGLSTTALELAHFPPALVLGKVVGSRSMDKMQTGFILDKKMMSDYGLGLRMGWFEGEKIIGHTGGGMSFISTLGYFPERKISIAVLVNSEGGQEDALSIFGPVALVSLGKGTPDLAKLENSLVNPQYYVGNYSRPEDKESVVSIVVYPGDSRLYRKRNGSNTRGEALIYLGNHSFAPEHYPMDRMEFMVDGNGSALAIKDYYNGFFLNLRMRKDD